MDAPSPWDGEGLARRPPQATCCCTGDESRSDGDSMRELLPFVIEIVKHVPPQEHSRCCTGRWSFFATISSDLPPGDGHRLSSETGRSRPAKVRGGRRGWPLIGARRAPVCLIRVAPDQRPLSTRSRPPGL